MMVESCEEKALRFNSAEELRCEMKAVLAQLEKAYRGKKPGKEGAPEWADRMDKTIDKALCLLKLQKQYPELKTAFAELDASAQRADEALCHYGTNMKLPKYVI